MAEGDTRDRIMKFLERNGPSLPVQIARDSSINTIFAGAFLSELYREGLILISHMKVGNSPLYLLPGQEIKLEKFISYLDSKEREAVNLLKEQGVIEDSVQQPAIRIALRNIKDFALPLKIGERIFWKYLSMTDQVKVQNIIENSSYKPIIKKQIMPNFQKQTEEKPKISMPEKETEIIKKQELQQQIITPQEKEEDSLFEYIPIKRISKKKPKPDTDRFLNEVKFHLIKRGIELIKTEQYNSKQVFAIIKIKGKECLLAAYNKKKIGLSEINKAYKKAVNQGLFYYILSKSDTPKKIKDTIDIYKRIITLDKIEPSTENNTQQ